MRSGYGPGAAWRRAVAIMVVVVVLIVLIGCAGRVIDVISWKIAVQKMQTAAADAVQAASIAAAAGENPAAVAKRTVAEEGLANGKDGVTVKVNLPPTQGRYAGSNSAIEIVISRVQPMYFTSLFLRLAPQITESTTSARAEAPLRWARE